MVTDTYNIQTRTQAKAQANAPTVVDTQPVAQKATPKIDKLPSEANERSNIKWLPSRMIQQSPKGIVLPPKSILPPIVAPPNISQPQKLPNVNKTTASPNQGPDPNINIEENSPHQEGIITENLCSPRSILFGTATRTD